MLRNSFCHIPGVGPRIEHRLWSLGYNNWDAILHRYCPALSSKRYASISDHLLRSFRELSCDNARYFEDHLPTEEHWRLFGEFRRAAAYLDIEATGLRWELNRITTIALYDGRTIHYYVAGRNLDRFPHDIRRYKLLVTYNGKCFDVPFIEASFGIRLDAAHIDLRYVLHSLGVSGGLKGCERQLGIGRGDLEGVDGYFAVLLWEDFVRRGNERALETLLAYNIEDAVNLERLMIHAFNRKLGGTPFRRVHEQAPGPPPPLPFRPDPETIRCMRGFHSI